MNNNQKNIDKTADTPKKPTPPKKRHRRIRIKPNVGGMLSLLLLIVIVAAFVTVIVFGVKELIRFVNEPKQTTQASTSGSDKPNPTPWNEGYVPTDYANSNLAVGDLILVNNANPYAVAIDKMHLDVPGNYKEFSGSYYVVRDLEIKVRSTMLQSLQQLLVAFVEANPDTLGSTTDKDQVFISEAYIAISEESKTSDHHTGLAVNLKVLKPGEPGKRENISLRPTEFDWLKAHCAEYGFVLRYDASKADITGVADEPNHLRYVGVPHATYMNKHNLCLEEYLELLRSSHKYEDTPLEINAGEKDYLVYYVAANTTAGAFTSIPVPPASEGTYTISGDNMNGFIVTVEKATK